MKIAKEKLENVIKQELQEVLNEQRKEIEEDVVVNGKTYKLAGQILTILGKTRVDLRLIDKETGEVVKAAKGTDVNKVKGTLGVNEQAQRTPTSGAAATLRKQIKDLQSTIPASKNAEYSEEVKKLNLPKSGLLLSQLQQLKAITQKYAFDPSKEGDRTGAPPEKPSAPTNNNVTQKPAPQKPAPQKPAPQQSNSKRKKTIALQTMLVKTGAAPRRLKNGKPFIDGDFGPATKTALQKFNQDFKTS